MWKRFLMVSCALPFLMAGGASSAFYLRLHHQASRATDTGLLPEFPRPLAADRRLLVIAPHCDDETLGVGALIADARRRGVPVTVAFLTNGDGFPIAAQRDLRDVAVKGPEMVRFAQKRQDEAIRAAEKLGVPESDVVFLGYPDQGLKALWETHWEREAPFRSRFTGCDRSPYPRTFTRNAPYSGSALLADLERLMRQVRPTDVFVTHPADDHPDHYTAAAFTQAALQACADHGGDGATWPATDVAVHYYLVHRGDWPLPQGAHPDRPLLPPPGLADTDTRWSSYRPTADALEAKRRALEAYRSQTAVMGRFLRSFVRENELFGALQTSRVAPHSAATIQDARRDDLVRFLDPATDVTSMSVAPTEDGRALRVLVTVRGPVSKRVRYALLLRASAPPLSRAARAADPDAPAMYRTTLTVRAAGARVLQTTVPLSALGTSTPRCVWIAAETRWQGTNRWQTLPPLDRFGYRPFLIKI